MTNSIADGVFDQLVYTLNSVPNASSLSEHCVSAIKHGVTELIITDRWDMRKADATTPARIKIALRAIQTAAEVFERKIKIYAGVEFCHASYTSYCIKEMLAELKADVVFGSLPYLPEGEHRKPYTETDFSVWSDRSVQAYVRRYYDALHAMLQQSGIDALTGLSGPLRVIQRQGRAYFSWYPFAKQIDRVLRLMAEREIALVFNMDQYLCTPEAVELECELLSRYRAFGGTTVMLGSGAQSTEHVAAGFELAVICLRRAGFRRYCCFEDREQFEMPLPTVE